jgi:hypothetical protein
MEDWYEKIDKERAELDDCIKACQQQIDYNRNMIRHYRAQKADLPRPPIKRVKKTPSVSDMLADLQADMQPEQAEGKMLITGSGTLTLTDAEGNDVTAENTVATDKD